MKIQEAIIEAQRTGYHIIRLGYWLSSVFVWVENGYIRSEHNSTQTGKPIEFDIKMLLSDEWEVVPMSQLRRCPLCQEIYRED